MSQGKHESGTPKEREVEEDQEPPSEDLQSKSLRLWENPGANLKN